ncbi:MAG: hypothetical protein LBT56_04205 [Prevotellaceae bacterium]|jgi:hypothetical protein|nr:hypothetical protein [Prevotellaceae bacterium]
MGGVLGMLIIDPATGAMWKLDTTHINATLYPSSHSENLELRIMDIKDVPNDLKSQLVKID